MQALIRQGLRSNTDLRVALLQVEEAKTELLMRHSTTTYLEVLTAQQSLLAAEQAQLQYRFNEVQGIIQLYHALGGGAL